MSNPSAQRGIWLVVVVLGAILCAVVSGVLCHLLGASALVTVGVFGATFTAITSLGLRISEFLSP